jgi:transposase-like protein
LLTDHGLSPIIVAFYFLAIILSSKELMLKVLTMKNTEIICPHCGNGEHIKKNGHYNKEIQRYKCAQCNKTFTLAGRDNRIKHPMIMKSLAISAYLDGMSLSSIQKMLSISFKTRLSFNLINSWIKNANNILGKELKQETQRRKEENPPTGEKTLIPIVEMDELFTFVKKNQK